MRTVATILVIFLVQCVYLRAEPVVELKKVGQFIGSDSCIFGVESISTYLYNSTSKGDTIEVEDIICDNVKSQPIAFVVHGFISSANATSFKKLTLELVQKGYIVFAVDWSQGACTNGIPIIKLMEYPFAVTNTRKIGENVARYVDALLKCNVSLKNITFIGHSLGAHICGFAAKKVKILGHGNIPLLIAADPAAPLFSTNKCTDKLCETDADCVKVLHTSTLGIGNSFGHLYLQFGDGKMGVGQPGCNIDVACSHTRSVEYLNIVLKNDCGFPGTSMKEKKVSKILPFPIFERPPSYPSSNTTDCIFVDSNILDNQCSIKGSFYVFVEENEPYCTQKTFNCNNKG